MTQALDYSWARPGGWRIAADGYVGVLRYLGQSPRDLSPRELAELHGAGLAVAVIWETSADRAGQGFGAGQADAAAANREASALGWPADRPIFYAVDFDARPEQVGPYFEALTLAPGRPVGIYGSYRIIEAFAHLPYRWQCAAWSGNGSGSGGSNGGRRLSLHAQLFQRVEQVYGGGADVNDIYADDWGQWHPDQHISTTPEDDDMATLAQALTGKPDPTDAELRDGLGKLVAFHLSGQARAEAAARGDALGAGNNVPWTLLDDLLSDGDALRLAVNTVAANRAAIVDAIEGLQLGGDVDAGAIAEAVVDALAAKLGAG